MLALHLELQRQCIVGRTQFGGTQVQQPARNSSEADRRAYLRRLTKVLVWLVTALKAYTCFQVVQKPAEADFILCHGTEAFGQQNAESVDMSLENMKRMLKACTEQPKVMPMIVANPDVVTVSGDLLIPMPGTLGEYYASLGGQVSAHVICWT